MLATNIFFLENFSLSLFLESSKQRSKLRSKISADKAKLTSRVQQYNEEAAGNQDADPNPCTVADIMTGNFPRGNNAG